MKNLIIGMRYMNIEGMLPFVNKVAGYVKNSSNHVMYRVAPFFEGENLMAGGVLLKAYSVEASRKGVCFGICI